VEITREEARKRVVKIYLNGTEDEVIIELIDNVYIRGEKIENHHGLSCNGFVVGFLSVFSMF